MLWFKTFPFFKIASCLLKRHVPDCQKTSVLGSFLAETLQKPNVFINCSYFKFFHICMFGSILYLLQVMFTKVYPKINSLMWSFWCLVVCCTKTVIIWLFEKIFSNTKFRAMPVFFFVCFSFIKMSSFALSKYSWNFFYQAIYRDFFPDRFRS